MGIIQNCIQDNSEDKEIKKIKDKIPLNTNEIYLGEQLFNSNKIAKISKTNK